MSRINEKVGAWLLASGNTREKLADAVGITRPTLASRLDGTTQWRFCEVVKLAEVLGASLNDLSGITDG